jgi:hypothetical protein
MNAQPQLTYNVALFLPLMIGALTTVLTIFIHGASGRAMIVMVVGAFRRGAVGVRFHHDVLVIALAAMILLAAHLVEVGLWGAVLMVCGEFRSFDLACYHSAVNYTTLGYGDIVMSARWRLMGPLESLDGMLLIGISTAALFTVIQRVTRTADPKVWEEISR